MCSRRWAWLFAVNLAACVTHEARFIDIEQPRAIVAATLAEKAKAETARSAAAAQAAIAAGVENETRTAQRDTAFAEATAPLRRELRELLEQRLVAARAIATFTDPRCASGEGTLVDPSPARCQHIAEIAAMGAATTTQIETAIASLDIDVPAVPRTPPTLLLDLSHEQARALLAASEREQVLDRELASRRAQRIAPPEDAPIEDVEIEVSAYGNLRLARYAHRRVGGERKREHVDTRAYPLVELGGRTRLLLEGDAELDPEVAGMFGFAVGTPCLFGTLQPFVQHCRGPTEGVSAGSLSAQTFSSSRFPKTPRAVPHYTYDEELGSMLGLSGGFAAGPQLRTGDGRGTFSRWSVAALLGVDVDLAFNLSKAAESEPRAVASVTPELVIRAGRSEAFELVPGRIIETGRATLVDLAAGARFDSYGRHGLSVRATVRPTVPLLGATVRYNRYADERGSSIVVGVELADQATLLPAAGVVVAVIASAIIFLVASCEDPEDDHCGRQP
jgi:hypothetical protein